MYVTAGTPSAWHMDMRALLALALLGGCFATGSSSGNGGGSRPGVMPMLSELPSDATKRDAVLDQSAQVARPEHRKGMTKKERQAETAAATAAAIIGNIFSKTQNATIGTVNEFDENHLIAPGAVPRTHAPTDQAADPANP